MKPYRCRGSILTKPQHCSLNVVLPSPKSRPSPRFLFLGNHEVLRMPFASFVGSVQVYLISAHSTSYPITHFQANAATYSVPYQCANCSANWYPHHQANCSTNCAAYTSSDKEPHFPYRRTGQHISQRLHCEHRPQLRRRPGLPLLSRLLNRLLSQPRSPHKLRLRIPPPC